MLKGGSKKITLVETRRDNDVSLAWAYIYVGIEQEQDTNIRCSENSNLTSLNR